MAYTVEQCRRVIRLQERIDVIKEMRSLKNVPDAFETMAEQVLKILEKEKERLLFKKPR